VRSDLERQVLELEPYPDLLRSTEQKLRDASDLLRQYEQRHLDSVGHITELTSKVGINRRRSPSIAGALYYTRRNSALSTKHFHI